MDGRLPARLVVPAGGIGGARFLRGLLDVAPPGAEITVIGNTGDDIWLHGLRVCPDLDTVMYTLGGVISAERGWGREDETFTVKDELAAYGVEPTWFGLGDRDIATHLVRTRMLQAGYPLSAVTEALCTRWQPGVRLLPMSDERAETHVIVDDPDGAVEEDGKPQRRALHFQEWWVRFRAALPAHEIVLVGAQETHPAPGVLEAIATADAIILPPSNPVVSIGTILQVPGMRQALLDTAAPIVGVSPIIGGRPVRGMADACLEAIGVETSAGAVGAHYGARASGGLLDGWLVDEIDAPVEIAGVTVTSLPLLMSDPAATGRIATAALDLAERLRL
ncbi:MAG: 2-phospho-L-lactate transferase [Candidatus Nanopelagicales bacterium]|jgi:LPPG:FO 2-phospho-L-lactate transferase